MDLEELSKWIFGGKKGSKARVGELVDVSAFN